MQTLIYTAIFDNYDTLQNVSDLHRPNVDFLCISNNISEKEAASKGWKLKLIQNEKSGTELNRLVKLGTSYLFDNDINVYIDGNKWITDINLLLEYSRKLYCSNKYTLLAKHWKRQNVFQECCEVIRLNKAPMQETINIYKYYVNNGFKDNEGLYCASVQIRKNTKEVDKFLESWYEEFLRFPYRDQISLPYVIYKENFKNKIYDISPKELLNFVQHRSHLR